MKIESVLQSIPVFNELLDGIPHGVAVLDTNLCVLTLNRFLEAMLGYNSDDVRGVYGDFILRSNPSFRNQVYKQVLESRESHSFDGDIITRRRKKIPVHFTLTCLHDDKGRPSGILIVLEDSSVVKVEDYIHHEESIRNDILGHSPQMEKVFELMSVLSRTDASVLITGETGTGKDLIAEALHKSSQRARQPFVKVNCGALPEALLESELFGHVKGAFTGAVTGNIGMFRLAHKGTIFLTEIGDLSLPLQVKLLSVLDDQEFFPVGGSKKMRVDVRVIAATHRSLRSEVHQGRFREDLFYRLNVLHLPTPPLRERDGDIRLLLDHFLRHFGTKLGRRGMHFSSQALKYLNRYSYPGNVRELRNIAEYSANICQGKIVGIKDLPQYLFRPLDSLSDSQPVLVSPNVSIKEKQTPVFEVQEKPAVVTRTGGWADMEKQMMLDALRESGGNRSKAAEKLGWGRTTLWRKLKKYKIA